MKAVTKPVNPHNYNVFELLTRAISDDEERALVLKFVEMCNGLLQGPHFLFQTALGLALCFGG